MYMYIQIYMYTTHVYMYLLGIHIYTYGGIRNMCMVCVYK